MRDESIAHGEFEVNGHTATMEFWRHQNRVAVDVSWHDGYSPTIEEIAAAEEAVGCALASMGIALRDVTSTKASSTAAAEQIGRQFLEAGLEPGQQN
jgi:hypothetical protein